MKGSLNILIPSMERSGGTERVAANLANYWIKDYNVTIITIEPFEESFYKLDSKVRVHSLNIARPNSLIKSLSWPIKIMNELRKYMKKQQGVLLGFSTNQACCALFALIGLDIPVIACEHTNYDYYKKVKSLARILHYIRKIMYPYMDAVVTLTDVDRIKFKEFCHKVFTIPNPVPLFSCDGLNQMKNSKTVLAVGRIDYFKGFDMLLTAWHKVVSTHPGWKLNIVGQTTDYIKEINSIILKLNLQSHVSILPPTKKISEHYLNANIFVLSSRREGFPMVLVEAMSVGLPVISFDCPTGPREIIDNMENGILLENGNIEELSKALSFLIENQSFRCKLGDSAKKVKERFGPDAVGRMWDSLLAKVID